MSTTEDVPDSQVDQERESLDDVTSPVDDVPVMQRIYNRIWLLAAAAMVFFFVVYVGWGLLDILTVPAR